MFYVLEVASSFLAILFQTDFPPLNTLASHVFCSSLLLSEKENCEEQKSGFLIIMIMIQDDFGFFLVFGGTALNLFPFFSRNYFNHPKIENPHSSSPFL